MRRRLALVSATLLLALPQTPAWSDCRWRYLGPESVPDGEGYDGSRVSVTGRLTGVVADPADARRLYVASASGGVWSSPDQGRTWRPLTDNAPCMAIGAIAIAPGPAPTLYAGTGEGNLALRHDVVVNDRPMTGDRGCGLLRSLDGGETWSLAAKDVFDGEAFFDIVVRGERIFAATTGGLRLSLDQGETWERLPITAAGAEIVTTLHVGKQGDVVIAGVYGSGLYRVDDAGRKPLDWTRLTDGLPLSNVGRIALASSGEDAYALFSTADGKLRGLYESRDSGASWTRIGNAPDVLQGQGFFTMALSVAGDEALFVGGAGDRRSMASSLYAGQRTKGGWRFLPVGSSLHIDLHAIVPDPHDPRTFHVATDGGLWTSSDGGATWTARNQGLGVMQFYRIDQHPRSRAYIIAGSQDNGTMIYRGSSTWDHVDDGDGGYVAIDPAEPSVVYDEFWSYKIARSNEGGARGSFRPVYPRLRNERSVLLAPFALADGAGRTIALALQSLHLSTDGGESWAAITSDLTRSDRTEPRQTHAISAIVFAHDDLLYAGTSDGLVWEIRKHAGQWRTRELTKGLLSHKAYVTSLFVTANRLYVTLQNDRRTLWHADRRRDGRVSSGLRAMSPTEYLYTVSVTSDGRPSIVVGTGQGVLHSSDGRAWNVLGENLPNVAVFHLQFHRSLPLLRAATHGRGVWELNRDCLDRSAGR